MPEQPIKLQDVIDELREWEMRILYSEHYKKLGYKCMLSIVTDPTEQQEVNRSRLAHTDEVCEIALRLWDGIVSRERNERKKKPEGMDNKAGDGQNQKLEGGDDKAGVDVKRKSVGIRDEIVKELMDAFKNEADISFGSKNSKEKEDEFVRTLISVIARAHDIGHTPFGHAGERAIQHVLVHSFGELLKVQCLIEKEKKTKSKVSKKRHKNKSNNTDESIERDVKEHSKAYDSVRRRCFRHGENSVRIIIREGLFRARDEGKKGGGIGEEAISLLRYIIYNGIVNHSWKPWEDILSSGEFKPTRERVYFVGQLVAMSDQLSTIVSDLEELEVVKYSDFTRDENFFVGNQAYGIAPFDARVKMYIDELKEGERKEGLKNRNICKYIEELQKAPTNSSDRFKIIIGSAIEAITLASDGKHLVLKRVEDAVEDERYSICLDILEKDIRKHVQKAITWFTARDNMAAAIIHTLFDHIWSRAPIPGTHTLREHNSRYLDEFTKFFQRYYCHQGRIKEKAVDRNHGRHPHDIFSEYHRFLKSQDFATWDSYILDIFFEWGTGKMMKLLSKRDKKEIKKEIGKAANKSEKVAKKIEKVAKWSADIVSQLCGICRHRNDAKLLFEESIQLIYLIALVDFIYYQTDSYCIAAFENIYTEFLGAEYRNHILSRTR